MQKGEEERLRVHRNICDALDKQNLRLQYTEEFLKLHKDNKHELIDELQQNQKRKKAATVTNKQREEKNSVNANDAFNPPKSPKRVNILQKELMNNNNHELNNKRKALQEETNKILKIQIEEKRNKLKDDEKESKSFNKKFIEDSQEQKQKEKNNLNDQKEKLLIYRSELEKQLGLMKCKSNKTTRGIIETNYQPSVS